MAFLCTAVHTPMLNVVSVEQVATDTENFTFSSSAAVHSHAFCVVLVAARVLAQS